MCFETLIVERDDAGFATVILNRPHKLNTLSIALRRELETAFAQLEADPGVRVLILTGAGKVFTAGLDLDEWASAGVIAAGAYEHDAVATLRKFSGPVIGAINGVAVTGGLEIALACDLLVAAEDARFADTHALVGLLPGWGGSVRLAQRVGLNRAKELALTGRFLGAREALEWGLVNRVVPLQQLRAEAEALARQMLAGAAETVVDYKRLLDRTVGMPMEEALRVERELSIRNNGVVDRTQIDERLAKIRAGRRS